jgi:hypothetical protein
MMLSSLSFVACGTNDPDNTENIFGASIDPETGKMILEEAERTPGKADDFASEYGISVTVDNSETAVWEVRNKWSDTDTVEANKAGMAWPENSNLDWDQKYLLWIDSMAKIDAHNKTHVTYQLTTPKGKTLPAPSLECAETAIFLRTVFAAWYGLPFFMDATDGNRIRVYFGHFGIRTKSGRYPSTPKFKEKYVDHSQLSQADIEADGWPSDDYLRQRRILAETSDLQSAIGYNAHLGTYLDEALLNKRLGHFLLYLLSNFGSIHLADPNIAFNIKPESIQVGDILVKRHQKAGIGHVEVLKEVSQLLDGLISVEIMDGNMPRRQARWTSPELSAQRFISPKTGGTGYNLEGIAYVDLGGGIKRWRTARKIDEKWYNVVLERHQEDWIRSEDKIALAKRPEQFELLLGLASPEEARQDLLDVISQQRNRLRSRPASCMARTAREEAFAELYEINDRFFNLSKSDTDSSYRILDDYVFAELDYDKSRTCCWNSSTSAMYEIIMDYNWTHSYDMNNGSCGQEPLVFMAQDGGYEIFRAHAASLGREDEWRDWKADEYCPQKDEYIHDSLRHEISPTYCNIFFYLLMHDYPEICQDDFADGDIHNHNKESAALISAGTYSNLTICSGMNDWFMLDTLPQGSQVTVHVIFSHAVGDIDLYAFTNEILLGESVSNTDNESISYTLLYENSKSYINISLLEGLPTSYDLEIVVTNP